MNGLPVAIGATAIAFGLYLAAVTIADLSRYLSSMALVVATASIAGGAFLTYLGATTKEAPQ